jgi:hypothetical protein
MLPVSRGTSSLWLECSYLQQERSLLRRLLDADHTRLVITDEAA